MMNSDSAVAPPFPGAGRGRSLAAAVRYWPILALAFLTDAALAAAVSSPVWQLFGGYANVPDVWTQPGVLPLYALLDQSQAGGTPAVTGQVPPGLFVLLALIVLPLAVALPAIAYRGGLLLTLREAPARLALGRFLWGAWHWFAPFTLIWLLEAIVTAVAWAVALVVAILAVGRVGVFSGYGLAAAVALAITFVFGLWTEYGRVAAVLGDTRDPFVFLRAGTRLLVRRPLPLIAVYLLGALLAGALLAVYAAVLGPVAGQAPVVVAIGMQQLVVLARLGVWLWRQAAEVEVALNKR